MKKNAPNISKVASDLILAYQQLTSQQKEITISPRYEKTALYFPQSPIEEQIEEENQIDSPRKTITEEEEDCLLEISELRRIVDQMRMKYMNIPEKYLQQPLQTTNQNATPSAQNKKPKKQVVITQYQSDFLRQQYGKIK
ncbi:unnamed protein product (macronuclear) [Paramecium tetraurelia]|uniref:Uncharacterized protein n=1 Tax=Paramecium tetraurelia TaxID=5888 RepID=A0CUY2_PARTE|nr:uncharacterized protein GSPATT00010767001 [Paramecium tetraurelia]CAK74599.1 unnamed protein product [Paramecium tetraurelia]|eukprot:XP_001441996.1 hypothetical protein (macronuclear) [Paramecium tetraurelia strain d4-2]